MELRSMLVGTRAQGRDAPATGGVKSTGWKPVPRGCGESLVRGSNQHGRDARATTGAQGRDAGATGSVGEEDGEGEVSEEICNARRFRDGLVGEEVAEGDVRQGQRCVLPCPPY